MRNVVFSVSIGDSPEYNLSQQSWARWCEKNDVELFILDQEIKPKEEMFYNFQRYYMFHLLESSGIDYDGVLTVDSDTLIHPNAPNIFEMTSRDKLYMVRDTGSYDWIIRGLEFYSESLFPESNFNVWNYGNSGFQLMGRKHKKFYDKMLKLWDDNQETIIRLSETYGLGKEQALWNLMIEKHNLEYEILPYKWNMTHIHNRELINTELLTNFGWIYHFNGLEGKDSGSVNTLMSQVYGYLNNEIK
tara:strand:- start:69 stop:806 length:738 start_codon:yes stop_codon:yes gene_type:complete